MKESTNENPSSTAFQKVSVLLGEVRAWVDRLDVLNYFLEENVFILNSSKLSTCSKYFSILFDIEQHLTFQNITLTSSNITKLSSNITKLHFA